MAMCDGLNEKASPRLGHLNTCFQVMTLFGESSRCGIVGEGTSPKGIGLEFPFLSPRSQQINVTIKSVLSSLTS